MIKWAKQLDDVGVISWNTFEDVPNFVLLSDVEDVIP